MIRHKDIPNFIEKLKKIYNEYIEIYNKYFDNVTGKNIKKR